MKIAVSATGPSLDAEVDPRLGRAPYFIIVESESMAFNVLENPFMNQLSGVGPQAAQLIAQNGAQIVITGNVGPRAQQALMAAGIKVITGASGKIKDVIEQYKQGRLSTLSQGVQPTFGMGMGRGMGIGGYIGSSDLTELKQKLDKMSDILTDIMKRLDALEGKK